MARPLKLPPGETLFRRGDEPKGLFLVESGEIRLIRVDAGGREIILFRAYAGDLLAEASLFSDVYHCDATAAAPSVVRLFPKAALLEAFGRDPAAARGFMAMLARQVMSLRTRLENRNLRTARDRVLHHIALHAEDGSVVIAGNLKAMAAELGLSHESLYRTLAALEAEGAIARTQHEIRLLSDAV
ncbi:Crp/Fnr family transcriptional regulator [Microvirga sesbaniae]|uniref:Crp/Fnr family transcriptional regulator n=1 Tax=Microvirga sesbaniae TaxID=681392 RepID=UPI0021C955CF|nr:Crp/Fnr family transcriptional regulator [Microvirga sp. HBU67692]